MLASSEQALGDQAVERIQTAGRDCLGRLDGRADDRFSMLQRLLEPIGPVEITHNLRGARWSKLAINCAISSLGTIGGHRLGELIRYRFVRRLGREEIDVLRADDRL